ncbi:MAG: TonB-dependent receptor [Bacteroidetes bacterium]|nr:TonB-dependent receptor [Bacteroidota bacterium]
MRRNFMLVIISIISISMFAQTPMQTVRGRVTDFDSKSGLPGANVILLNSTPLTGSTTNAEGYFVMEKVPVGRQSFKISYIGYKTVIRPGIMVSSGKEVFLSVELPEEVFAAREVEIKATVDKDKPVNSMAMVSARSFSVEESRRYAGSADDPMRAVSNFAGVASSADVNSNQIVIRGNSPKGLLWRVDGVDIPNPNHYAYVGTSGGGLTMFSSQVLSNSDFYTAAFPAEYGNALSGVFDMRFRNGNNTRHEFALQVGIQGLDVSAEGPFSRKSGASYLFNYRYSILAFLQYIDPGMKNKIPSYQDLSFKINLPAGKAGTFSIVGIGGISRSKFIPEKDSAQWQTLEDRTKSMLNNNMGALSLSHQVAFSRKSFLRSFLSGTYNSIAFDNGYLTPSYTIQPQDSVKQKNYRFTGGTTFNHKFGPKHTNRTGLTYARIFYNSDIKAVNPSVGSFSEVYEGRGNTDLVQCYSESKIEITGNIAINAGLHVQYFLLNRHYAIEPRIAVRWQPARDHAFTIGYGKHAQTEDIGLYLTGIQVTPEQNVQPNRKLDFSRSHHFVLGYDYTIRPALRLKVEGYYQLLYDVPVIPGNYYSLINSNGGFYSDTFVNDGTGRNAGIDITLEKFLTRQYYYLVTVSLFDSKYKGGDGIERNTRYNSNYVVNIVAGKEWTIRKKNILGLNLKTSLTGGEYYVPINLEQSKLQHQEVLNEALAYKERLPDFYYIDLTLTYRTNHRKFSGVWAIQVKNLLNQKPPSGYIYNDYNQSAEPVVSMGVVPFLSYKVEF